MIDWLTENWLSIAIPLLAFLATYVVGLWLRGVVSSALERWVARAKWRSSRLVASVIRRPFLLWFLLIGAAISAQVSVLPALAKVIVIQVAASLFIVSIGWLAITLAEQLLRQYLPRMNFKRPSVSLAINVVRLTFIVVTVLIVLDVWGMPTTPVLLLIAVAAAAAALVFRNTVPSLFAGFQLGATQQIKPGDYIKLETGEEGYVIDISWNTTQIQSMDESMVMVPNSRLLQHTVVNYGHPLRKASEPFRFSSRTHLTELTGLRSRNLRELADILREAPDPVIYYHTHRFLEEHHYLTPEPSNDFAIWVSDALGDVVLGEKLASVNTFEFPNLRSLRDRLVSLIEECVAGGLNSREAMAGREFHFMKSVSVVVPTHYVAHDLREFVENLRKISLGSLYFHVFESRLRLGRELNDFTIWLRDSLEEAELGDEIARLDPYTYTLEALRSTLIQLIEKRIK